MSDLKRFLAFGTGVGIEIGPRDLNVSVVKMRPSGSKVAGTLTIERFHERPAVEWGAEYSQFLKQEGARHVAAWVVLPRSEMIVRHLTLPGVADKDLASAVGFQMDSLHPWAEEDAFAAWARIGKSANVLVGLTRREVIDTYSTLFSEAGIKVAAFTFSAAVIYSAIRVFDKPPAEFFVTRDSAEGLEIYGESTARPVFSALFDAASPRARSLAASELRLPPDTEPKVFEELAPSVAHTAAMSGATPWLAMQANLLPEAMRSGSARAIYIPTILLSVMLVVLFAALLAQPAYEDHKYVKAIEAEIAKLQPTAAKVKTLDRDAANARTRTILLDDFRSRTKADMDSLNEMTRLIAPPSWLNYFDLSRTTVQIAGESDQAANLLKIVDESKLFGNSEFTMPIARVQNAEAFRIRTQRETPPAVVPAAPVPVAPAGQALAPVNVFVQPGVRR